VDGYLVEKAPWKMASEPAKSEELAEILYTAAETVRIISILVHPVLPDATQSIWKNLGQPGNIEDQNIHKVEWGGLVPGTRISKPQAIFPRIDYKESSERIEAMENEIRNPAASVPTTASTASAGVPASTTDTSASSVASAVAPPSVTESVPKIGIEDFAKVEMRVGLVKSAEKVAGADKLLKVIVDIGDEIRQIVAGIATAYQPEELVGRKVVIVANLAPRKLRGVESNGMIVAASAPDGQPVLCTFTEDVPIGARLK
jgi:methionyl-tRNA synthetase